MLLSVLQGGRAHAACTASPARTPARPLFISDALVRTDVHRDLTLDHGTDTSIDEKPL